jgi:hypothetical protein
VFEITRNYMIERTYREVFSLRVLENCLLRQIGELFGKKEKLDTRHHFTVQKQNSGGTGMKFPVKSFGIYCRSMRRCVQR